MFPQIYFQTDYTIQSLKESKWCSAGAVNMQSKHVTDAETTSKMPLQVPVEIFKEPDAAASCLPQLRMCPVITFQRGDVIQYAEKNSNPFLSLYWALSAYLEDTCISCVCMCSVYTQYMHSHTIVGLFNRRAFFERL